MSMTNIFPDKIMDSINLSNSSDFLPGRVGATSPAGNPSLSFIGLKAAEERQRLTLFVPDSVNYEPHQNNNLFIYTFHSQSIALPS